MDEQPKVPPGVIPPWQDPTGWTKATPEEAEKVEKAIAEKSEAKEAEEEKPKPKYRVVRGGGDPVFLLKDNKRHWILNPIVMKEMGYKFGDEEKIPQSELETYMPGVTITKDNWKEFI